MRNNFGNRSVPKSQVSVLGNSGLEWILNKKGEDILCDHDARFVREQPVNYVGDNDLSAMSANLPKERQSMRYMTRQ